MSDRRGFFGTLMGALAVPHLFRPRPSAAPARPPRMPKDLAHLPEPRFWAELRREFSIPPNEVFFNTGTLGSSPLAVQEAVFEHMRHVDRDIAHWDYLPDHEQYFTGYFPELPVREAVGRVIGAAGKDVALCQNATHGMNFVAMGLDLKAGDEVVVTHNAHPGGRKGYDLRA